jgi:hypothetical protein
VPRWARRSVSMLVMVGAVALGATAWHAHAAMEIGQPAALMVADDLDGRIFDLHAHRGVIRRQVKSSSISATRRSSSPAGNDVTKLPLRHSSNSVRRP